MDFLGNSWAGAGYIGRCSRGAGGLRAPLYLGRGRRSVYGRCVPRSQLFRRFPVKGPKPRGRQAESTHLGRLAATTPLALDSLLAPGVWTASFISLPTPVIRWRSFGVRQDYDWIPYSYSILPLRSAPKCPELLRDTNSRRGLPSSWFS